MEAASWKSVASSMESLSSESSVYLAIKTTQFSQTVYKQGLPPSSVILTTTPAECF
jgi:hypothetical protein